MNYLKIAENYAMDQGDEYWFKEIYTNYRQYNDVAQSVWMTLCYLYGSNVANKFKDGSK